MRFGSCGSVPTLMHWLCCVEPACPHPLCPSPAVSPSTAIAPPADVNGLLDVLQQVNEGIAHFGGSILQSVPFYQQLSQSGFLPNLVLCVGHEAQSVVDKVLRTMRYASARGARAGASIVLGRPYTAGGGGVPPPPLLPFQCLRLTATILLRRLRCQEDFRFKSFDPPLAGTIGEPWEEGGPRQTPCPPAPPFTTSLGAGRCCRAEGAASGGLARTGAAGGASPSRLGPWSYPWKYQPAALDATPPPRTRHAH